MLRRLFLHSFLITAGLFAVEPATNSVIQPVRTFSVIEQTTVPQQDGGSVTFKRVEPPPVEPPRAPLPALVLTPAELAREQELENKAAVMLAISASVHPQGQGRSVLRWSCGGRQLQAVCNVNFHHVAGLGQLETAQCWYSIFMAIGTSTEVLPPEAAQAAQYLPADGRPSFVLFDGQDLVNAQDEQAWKAMDDLLEYFAAHKAELVAQHDRREAEARARELAHWEPLPDHRQQGDHRAEA